MTLITQIIKALSFSAESAGQIQPTYLCIRKQPGRPLVLVMASLLSCTSFCQAFDCPSFNKSIKTIDELLPSKHEWGDISDEKLKSKWVNVPVQQLKKPKELRTQFSREVMP
jgi:hypothetical protein